MANNSTEVKIGIIGAGIGASHIRGYKQVPQAQITALCDVDETRARQVVQTYGLDEVEIYQDYRVMLQQAKLDAVSVALPNFLHAPVAIDCLNSGLHVLCEKPLAMNAAQAQQIADATAQNSRHCMVGQVMRFRADARHFKQLAQNGEFGRLYYAHAVALRPQGIPGYGGWFTNKTQSGGGPLIDIGVHILDLAWWLAGCPAPLTASAVTYAEFGPHRQGLGSGGARDINGLFNVEDLAVGLLRFEGGLTINLEVAWALQLKKQQTLCEVFGTEGGFECIESNTIVRPGDDGTLCAITPEIKLDDNFAAQTGHFVQCILENRTPDPDATQGVTMMKMLDALYQSATLGREIAIS